MSETTSGAPAPARRWNWLAIALIASLAVNLFFIGAGIARFYVGPGPERLSRATQMQLIPRRFFAELERPRRLELLGVIKGYDKDFRDGRRSVREQVNALADALAADPYDPARVKAAVDAFAQRSDALLTQGSTAALALFERLKPEERKLIATQLRSRGGPPDKAGGAPDGKPVQD